MTELAELFAYDRWANRKWLACLEAKGWPELETAILGHVFAAQEIWAMRGEGVSAAAMPAPDVSIPTLEALHDRWKALLARVGTDERIDYRRTTGEANSMSFGHIARHVINHGTYHRGELRGLCRAREDNDFPETDFAGFVLEGALSN